MTVVVVHKRNGRKILRQILRGTGMESFAKMIQNCTFQTGVTDGGADLELGTLTKGSLIYDVDNSDYYIVTTDSPATANLNV